MGVAQEILRCLEEEASRHRARKVVRATLSVGTLSCIETRSLAFCLEAISVGSALNGIQFEIEESQPEIVCADCGTIRASSRFPRPICPRCGREAKIRHDRDVLIKEIELDVENH